MFFTSKNQKRRHPCITFVASALTVAGIAGLMRRGKKMIVSRVQNWIGTMKEKMS